ncbi:MAG: uroporphyrinogen-III synthase [Bacteroidales bacterium]|nr:uroporphyrinogen-III synthase [Bacteroidales bacterium]
MGIKDILISQPAPQAQSSPYTSLIGKYGLNIDFRPFFKVEQVSLKEFRSQKVNFLDYTAIVFTSRLAIDSFFKLSEELRITIPETMKYFCQSEAIAFYLQKYIVYRKRKIFYGNGTVPSIMEAIGTKHKGEKFLITCTDALKPEINKLFTRDKLAHGSVVLAKTVYSDLSSVDLHKYQMVVFYSPSDVRSLKENFPDFEQKELLFAIYGPSTAKAMKAENLKVEIEAPTPEYPSIAEALNHYLGK